MSDDRLRALSPDPTGFPARAAARIGFSLIGAGLGWVALISWSGLIEQPGRFLGAAFYGGLVIATIGGVLRARRVRWYAVLVIQSVALLVWLQSRTSPRGGIAAWLPTPDGIRAFVDSLAQGASDVNTYASPVSLKHPDAVEYLLALGLVVILSIDVLGVGLRRSPWAGLPVVIALTVPVSVLEESLSVFVFGACSLLFVLLLAGDEAQRVRTWAHRAGDGVAGAAEENPVLSRPTRADPTGPASVRATAAGIGLVAAAFAFVLPFLVPVGDGIVGRGEAFGPGRGHNAPVNLVNPIIDLHKDLTRGGDTPLVIATTADRDRDYLRLTVLDAFDGERWRPSKRDLPGENKTDGALPAPAGLNTTSVGTPMDWALRLTSDFQSAWLAAPYPLRAITTDQGDWRFDSRTLDFVRVDEETGAGTEYRLTALHPLIDADSLEAAPAPPPQIRTTMTKLPSDLSPVVADTAREVTAGASTDYARMVLLQDWFRADGGFEYSLARDDGSTSDALERFITDERSGYCEQFAAAMAIMARSIGVPARVVVGFLKPDHVEGTALTYTTDSLHAWPEVYFEGTGWVRFEPTPPSRTGVAPSWTRELVVPTRGPSSVPSAAPLKPPTRRALEPAGGAVDQTSHGNGTRLALLALLAAGLSAGTIPALVRRRQRHRRLHVGAGAERADVAAAMWTELLATALDLRLPLHLERSIRTVADALAAAADPDDADRARLERLVALVEEARYGPQAVVDLDDARQMVEDVRRWSHLLATGTSRGQRVAGLIAPRSLLLGRVLENAPRAVREHVGAGEIS